MFQKLRRSFNRHLLGKDPDYNDPYDDPAEQFYARIYLKYLFQQIETEFRGQAVKVLDVGCHTGRLAVPLARAGYQVTAIDSSRFHLKLAERHARAEGTRCHWIKGDAFQHIRHMEAESFDLVICTEVLYQREDFREEMRALARLVRKGGLLATSHRTRFFYLTKAVAEKDYETAERILEHSEGPVGGGSYFNWQTPGELKDLYRQIGVEVTLLRPIGIFTGNGDEGMARICNLAGTTETEKKALFDIEASQSEEFASIGRYLLVIGRKSGILF